MVDDVIPTPGSSPATLDRSAMERVLARAAELASQSSSDAPDVMTEAQLLEIGKEVGLSATMLQQALAEERTRVVLVEETGLEARVMGPNVVSATRVVSYPADAVITAVEAWMATDYRFIPKRRAGNRRTWEPRSGALGRLERELRSNRSVKALTRATEVSMTVSPIGDGRTVVRFDADLREQRRGRRNSGLALGAAGITTGAVPIILGAVLAPIAMLPLFVAFAAVPLLGFTFGGVSMMRGQREQAERSQTALEQLLDRLEHEPLTRGALPNGAAPLLSETISAVAQGVRDVAKAVQDAAAAKRMR
jgi:hypothetical protein